MQRSEAIDFIQPALGRAAGTWVDLGAGRGTFTAALSTLLGPEGKVVAVDQDPRALASLERLARTQHSGAPIEVVAGDLTRLDRVPQLQQVHLDGALLANALHFLADAHRSLTDVVRQLRPGGRVVVIEYERRRPNPWVPYPLPFTKLSALLTAAGLSIPEIVARRPSAYHGQLYCALAFTPSHGTGEQRSPGMS